MEKEVRGARKVVFDNAAHLLNMEHPDRFEGEIRAFLKS
jgi:pimeloyl-ACP methyl ester carboxylesterase